MSINSVDDMVHAYMTSPALRAKVVSIMANESEYVTLEGNGSYASSSIMSPPDYKARCFCFKGFKGFEGFEGAKLGRKV